MPQGSCFCGNVKISYEGDALATVVCHCMACRKISGSAFSTNILVPSVTILSGSTKTVVRVADSGQTIHSHICGDCGSTLWLTGEKFGDNVIVQAGVLDDEGAVEAAKPAIEQYITRRPGWIAPVDEANQFEASF
ncbi:Mss4-like protein [Xylariaceae sp. FL0255]|nr:Mss4-like protein [Xylariaceae sp. FL0255]